jgi:hypothetical protein
MAKSYFNLAKSKINLTLVLLLLTVSAPVRAQNIIPDSTGLWASFGMQCYGNGWCSLWVYNGDDRDWVDTIALSHLWVWPEYIHAGNPGWQETVAGMENGTTEIWWHTDTNQIAPGSWAVLDFEAVNALNWSDGGWCALGSWLGNCGPTSVPAW